MLSLTIFSKVIILFIGSQAAIVKVDTQAATISRIKIFGMIGTPFSLTSFTSDSVTNGLISTFKSLDTNNKVSVFMVNDDTSTVGWSHKYE